MWQGLSNPYPFQTKISAKVWTLCRQMTENFKNIHPKTPENEFLALYLCILKIFRKNCLIKKGKLCYYERLRPLIDRKRHPLQILQAKKTPFADFRVKNQTLICRTSISLAIWKCPPPPEFSRSFLA